MGKVVVFGSLNMDYIISVNDFPKPGETVLGNGYGVSPGGKGANQAIAARRAGAETIMLGAVGNDADAIRVKETLLTNKVDASYVREVTGVNTGAAFVFLAEDGENQIIVTPGANACFKPEKARLSKLVNCLRPDDVIVAQLEIPIDAVIEIGRMAKETGNMFVLNAAPGTKLPGELLESINLLIVNESELSTITGKTLTTFKEIKTACSNLCGENRNVVVTLGSNGCFVTTKQGAMHFEAIEVDVIDTTGAGDAFVGGLAAMLAEGKDLYQAVLFAVVAGGLTTTKKGAQNGIPTRSKVDAELHKLIKKGTLCL